jgi:hypothetical protein
MIARGDMIDDGRKSTAERDREAYRETSGLTRNTNIRRHRVATLSTPSITVCLPTIAQRREDGRVDGKQDIGGKSRASERQR